MNHLPHWWQNGVIYQIYPKSFQDTTGSGTGDLRGVTARLDYLQKLGVDAIWLTPFYVSPQVDNGYDVANYTAIDPSYGTMADFDALVAEAKARGIRIVLDMVLNHTSTEHEWFRQSLNKESPYRQFYIWRDGEPDALPNNWRSKFGGNAWQWHADSGQYYLHLFAIEQADLNWENPAVRAELKKVCEFWADRGVDGLRLDVVNLISKDQTFPCDLDGDGRRFYTDGPRVHEFLQEMSRDVFTPRNLMTVGEMSSTSLEHCQQYAALDGRELSMTFNFHHLKVDYPGGEKWTLARPDYVALKALFRHWQQGMHNRAWNALFWCNHDQPRIVSRLGDETAYWKQSAKMLAGMIHFMRGTPYIYQGEEIGMLNAHYPSIEQYRDVESLNYYQILLKNGKTEREALETLAARSRDNSRTPMQWNGERYGGFSETEPWLPMSAGFRNEITVEAQQNDQDSILSFYKKLIAMRKMYPVIAEGEISFLETETDRVLAYQRKLGEQQIVVFCNLDGEKHTVKADGDWRGDPVLLENYEARQMDPEGETYTMEPYEFMVLGKV